jgi:type I restriction enzyme R subunit
MIQRMSENDGIVTRYMDDQEFQNTAFPILAKAIFETVRNRRPAEPT